MTSNEDTDVIELLKTKITEAKQRLSRLEAALASVSTNGASSFSSSSWETAAQEVHAARVTPPITDICAYLQEKGGIVHQGDIIRDVGEWRRVRYPNLTNHYSPVWRALEYHVRHNRLILCVDRDGAAAALKPLPHRPKGQKVHNGPSLYEQDNWFVLKPAERDITPHCEAAGHSLFGQD